MIWLLLGWQGEIVRHDQRSISDAPENSISPLLWPGGGNRAENVSVVNEAEQNTLWWSFQVMCVHFPRSIWDVPDNSNSPLLTSSWKWRRRSYCCECSWTPKDEVSKSVVSIFQDQSEMLLRIQTLNAVMKFQVISVPRSIWDAATTASLENSISLPLWPRGGNRD